MIHLLEDEDFGVAKVTSPQCQPARYDGINRMLIGGAELDDANVLSGDPLEFQNRPVQ